MDRIFCFCCKLFKTPKNVTRVGQLGNDGFKDWHNLHRSIKSHEGNEEHLYCMTNWIELENTLRTKTTIDKGVELLIDAERGHWRHVLIRIIAIVKRLAKNALTFRGDDERLNVENNGLFLQMVEMVSEFDPIMKEHLRRTNAKEIQYTYLGKKIQNELIQLLANEVRSAIVKKVKQAKYFAIILDCTPDASLEEQMSLIVRFVDDSANLPTVEEYWLEFLKVDDTTGLGLTTELQKALIKLDLDIDNIRGQWYDNRSNMSGKHKDNVKGLTVKPLSQTRWESHVESVNPIMEQTTQIRKALLDLAETNEDPKVKSEVESLATHELQNFEFLLGMVIWYRLLHAVNIVSKFLETESMDIDHAIDLLQGLISFLEDYREIGFAIAMDEAIKKANEMGIEAETSDSIGDKSGELHVNIVRGLPQQQNGYDCGIFVIKYAQYLLHNDLGNMPMSFDAGNARLEIPALLFKNKQLKQIGKGSSKSDE
ncbi:zinc finger MYM-type protein 1-like [Olea europaea var. sylvestris]|uniref:zinc finger MYM-type protein 1-like n=1 Tax=Olea europaea var. sylvestris TaxID=158386 RepID=UPI000C1D4F14|nr:zinc finger MYM-type protein 1-like [Olea europaea var. sylvestris]